MEKESSFSVGFSKQEGQKLGSIMEVPRRAYFKRKAEKFVTGSFLIMSFETLHPVILDAISPWTFLFSEPRVTLFWLMSV